MIKKHTPSFLIRLFLPIFLFSIILNIFFIYNLWNRNRVVKVVDGDSLDLSDGRRVRLLGIDTPEKGNCMYTEAKSLLQKIALGRHVRLKNPLKDSYGRLLANVIVEDFPAWLSYLGWRYFADRSLFLYPNPDPYLNRGILTEGFARDTGSNIPAYKNILKKAENFAKEKKLGIWSGACLQTVPPNPDCLIKANIRQGVKNYYLPECPSYAQVIINTSYGDSWFCAEDEAIQAGFVKNRGCE